MASFVVDPFTLLHFSWLIENLSNWSGRSKIRTKSCRLLNFRVIFLYSRLIDREGKFSFKSASGIISTFLFCPYDENENIYTLIVVCNLYLLIFFKLFYFSPIMKQKLEGNILKFYTNCCGSKPRWDILNILKFSLKTDCILWNSLIFPSNWHKCLLQVNVIQLVLQAPQATVLVFPDILAF